jgi:hypothetical protein
VKTHARCRCHAATPWLGVQGETRLCRQSSRALCRNDQGRVHLPSVAGNVPSRFHWQGSCRRAPPNPSQFPPFNRTLVAGIEEYWAAGAPPRAIADEVALPPGSWRRGVAAPPAEVVQALLKPVLLAAVKDAAANAAADGGARGLQWTDGDMDCCTACD